MAWMVDAVDLAFSDLQPFNDRILHSTYEIDQFIRGTHSNKLLIVAPKGLGKTMLMKIKRLVMQREGIQLFPTFELLDRPIGSPPVLSREKLTNLASDYDYWQDVWRIAIAYGVTRSLGHAVPSLPRPKRKRGTEPEAEDEAERRFEISDILKQVSALDLRQFNSARELFNTAWLPCYRKIRTPAAFFIDNVDEWLKPFLPTERGLDDVKMYKNRDRSVWYNAQNALARIIHDFHGVNKHIKVFASIRREAYNELSRYEPVALQIDGNALEVKYSKSDLYNIFCKNIVLEARNRLVAPEHTDPLIRFVGEDNRLVAHPYTGREEPFFDFVLRHTFHRPRDLMALGGAISALAPEERTADRLRETIYETAAKVADAHITDVRQFVELPDMPLLMSLIDRNVLGGQQIAAIAATYRERLQRADGEAVEPSQRDADPFGALYRAGLLGHVRKPRDGELLQDFTVAGDIRLDAQSPLPESEHYLIHPALDEQVIDRVGDVYKRHYHGVNIIGRGRPWLTGDAWSFICKADIVGYSQVMLNADFKLRYPAWLEVTITQLCRDLLYSEPVGGDSLLLIDSNARRLLAAMRMIAKAVNEYSFPRQIRFAACEGHVDFLPARDGNGREEPTGLGLRTAARLEPHAPPNHLLASQRFAAAAAGENGDGPNGFRRPTADELPGLDERDGQFVVRKKKADDPEELWDLRVAPLYP